MTRIKAVHLFGSDGRTGDWGRAAAEVVHSHRYPSPGEITRALTGPRPVALALADRIEPRRLTSTEAEPGVTLFAANVAAATDGRASSDLLFEVLQVAPAVGILLVPRVLELGAVVFGTGPQVPENRELSQSTDALGEAIAASAERGEVLRVQNAGEESAPALPTDPPRLRPRSNANKQLSRRIERFDPDRSIGPITSSADAAAVKAGVWLWFDFLDESHRISQSIEGEGRSGSGDYWHAIMHRREGDYGNAKYWFRRVGRSPVFAPLAERVPRLAAEGGETGKSVLRRILPGGKWDPLAFVDACADSERSGDPQIDLLLRRLQADEMLLLLLQTLRDARG